MGILNIFGKSEKRNAEVVAEVRNLTSVIDTQNASIENLSGKIAAAMFGDPDTQTDISWVVACLNIRSNELSSLPFNIYRTLPNGDKEEAKDHPIWKLLNVCPFGDRVLTFRELLKYWMYDYDVHGNAYAFIERDKKGTPIAIIPLPAAGVQVVWTNKKPYYRVNGSMDQWGWLVPSGDYPAYNIIHIRNQSSTARGLTGGSALKRIKNVLAALQQMDVTAMEMNALAAHPIAAIKLSRDATENKINALVKRLSERGKYDPIVTEPGTEINTFGGGTNQATVENLQFTQAVQLRGLEICNALGVPPYRVGLVDSRKTATSTETDNLDFHATTNRPNAETFCGALNLRLLESYEDQYKIEVDFDEMRLTTIAERYEANSKAIQSGWKTINEVRRDEGLPAVEGGDVLLRPLNMTTGSAA